MGMLRARPQPPKMGSLPRRLRNMISRLLPAFQSLMQQQQQWRLLRYWQFCYQRTKENQVFVRQIQKFYTPKTIQSCGTSFHFTRFGASSSCLTRLGASSHKLGWLLVMT